MYSWLPEGTLVAQWARAVIRGPLVSWAPVDLGAPSRAGGPLLGEILDTYLMIAAPQR